MLRIMQVGNSLPMSFIVDPSAEFEPGQVAQLTVNSSIVMATVSDGKAPLGVIDDIKTKAFTNRCINLVVIVEAIGVDGPSGRLVTPVDIVYPLPNPNLIRNSFSSKVPCILNENNGIITFPAGTELNYDLTGTGQYNAIKTIVNYTYYVANVPGDDSTFGSGRVTVWFQRMFIQVSTFESNVSYPVNANLFINETGLFTTRKPSAIHPSVGIVTSPPNKNSPWLELMWL